MKILNKKGFILVETLIVTAFVLLIFILIYHNVVPYIGTYEVMANYDDIDSVYKINTFKKMLIEYGNFETIDNYLTSNTYMNISDCNDSTVYKNFEYCVKLKESLKISDNDYIFITSYNIKDFRTTTKSDVFFDSSKLSNFRDYVSTVSNIDTFYDPNDDSNQLVGKYRIFLVREVINKDKSKAIKYANLGIYSGKFKRYNIGEVIDFNPGDGIRQFYVLKNSSASEPTVTLILNTNLSNNVKFNLTNDNSRPDVLLNSLKSLTNSWVNANLLTSATKYQSDTYTISYDGYRARLLEPDDLYDVLRCTDKNNCFDIANFFSVYFDKTKSGFISANLTGNNGYWLASSVKDNNEMAWTVQDGKITPVLLTSTTTIGVRPVIIVDKSKLN